MEEWARHVRPRVNQLVGTVFGTYRLDQLLAPPRSAGWGRSTWPEVRMGAGSTYLVRILAVPTDHAPQAPPPSWVAFFGSAGRVPPGQCRERP